MLLRGCGLFSKMIINHDLKIITQNPNAWLNPDQEELLTNIGAYLSWPCKIHVQGVQQLLMSWVGAGQLV